MKWIAVLCFFAFAPGAFAQVVSTGKRWKTPKDYCYKIETISPNLVLSESAHISGRISIAATGLALNNSRVELRKYISQRKQITVKVATTNEMGYFDIGTVEAGHYRFLASPDRSLPQPSILQCFRTDCKLDIALGMNATDQPDSICPVR